MGEIQQRIDDGGSMYPSEQGHIPDGTWNQTYDRGCSVRMWLAGIAMQGILACEQAHPNISQTNNEDLAECAVEIADATIKAERKDQSP